MNCLRLLLCATFVALVSAVTADELPSPDRHFLPTEQWVQRSLAGWKVLVHPALLTPDAEVGATALALLETKLTEVRALLPPGALAAVEKVPIWLGVDDHDKPNAVYHPSAGWLREHGWNPDKAGAVEIPNAAIFIEWSRTQPMMVLHELAHAYHHQVLTHAEPGLRAAYERAKAGGSYDRVRHASGRMERAYALSNVEEFFAESTEAYFGKNDFFPSTRDELRAHDPETCSLLEELWNR